MGKRKRSIAGVFTVILACAVIISAGIIGAVYFRYISKSIYEDSTVQLGEVYGQVNRAFGTFVERNWGLLESWNEYFEIADKEETEKFLSDEKANWGYSQFYFINAGTCRTLDGSEFSFDIASDWSLDKPVLYGLSLSDGTEMTCFASPAGPREYDGFEYNAIAITYSSDDMANSLNVDAFSGKAKCFIIRNDGRVLLSTQSGGSVFGNYLTYLTAASDLTEEEAAAIRADWENGRSGVMRCRVGDEKSCILYQPVGYQDYLLLSVVPENVMSAGFVSVQKTTTNVLILIFVLISATVLALTVLRYRKQSKKTRTELMYRERMFDVLSNSVDDIFIMLDADKFSVEYVSPNIKRLLGIPASEARKNIRTLEKCAVDGDITIPREELLSIPLNENRYWEREYMHQSTGERRWYRMTVYHLSLQGTEKYISVMSDRTLEQQMNQKLTEALNAARSANEAKSNFLSNMSHDIRTPMNAIVGFSVLLEKDADKPEKVREYTRKISASSHHLLSLINDVLDMSKIESGKTSLSVDVFSLPQVLEELKIIMNPQAKAKSQEFRTLVQGNPPENLLGDRLRLNQILLNLLSNAVKYTPEGGKIDFTVSDIFDNGAQYAKLRFTVKDNGIGMSPEYLKTIFLPFSREINSVTNKVQGTGLGMAITKNLVDLMGGIINVESEPGKGSVFTVELTFARAEKTEETHWADGKITKMLVADDEEDICISVKELMEEAGVKADYSTDGETAVKMAVSAHDKGEGYSVILLDWKMPGLNGVETAKQIRQKIGDDVPILVLTSYDWSDIEDEARSAGINAFMPKPFFTSTFFSTLKPLYGEKPEGPEDEKSADPGVMSGLRFLVAEDNDLNAEILTEMLKLEGAECDLAVNGKEAVEMFTNSKPGYYDMILMDVQMPVMNGYEATKAIRDSGHPLALKVPIAAMTANTFAEDVQNALESGMDGHIAKPIDMNAVRETVARLINKNR